MNGNSASHALGMVSGSSFESTFMEMLFRYSLYSILGKAAHMDKTDLSSFQFKFHIEHLRVISPNFRLYGMTDV